MMSVSVSTEECGVGVSDLGGDRVLSGESMG